MNLQPAPQTAAAPVMGIVTALAVFALEWRLCYFLYRKGIFFKV